MRWDKKLQTIEEAVKQYNDEQGYPAIDMTSESTGGRAEVTLYSGLSVHLDDMYDRLVFLRLESEDHTWSFSVTDDDELEYGHPDDFDARGMLGDLLAELRAEYEDVTALIDDAPYERHMELYNRYASTKYLLYDLLRKYGGLND